jgi:hypothetical protein
VPVSGGPSATPALSVSGVALSPARFHRGRHLATISRAKPAPVGTTVSFQLSQAASVTLSFERVLTGVRSGHRCVAPGRSAGKRQRCSRLVLVAGGVQRSAHAGVNRIHFEGVLDGATRLSPGSYRLSLAARSASATGTAVQHPIFTLLG